MTALSTIFGMIPIALATSDGAEFRNAMGIIVIGGLLSSTLLTLFVVPTAFTLLGDSRSIPRRARQMLEQIGAKRRTAVASKP